MLQTAIISPNICLYYPVFINKKIHIYQVICQCFHFNNSLDMYKPMSMCVCMNIEVLNIDIQV